MFDRSAIFKDVRHDMIAYKRPLTKLNYYFFSITSMNVPATHVTTAVTAGTRRISLYATVLWDGKEPGVK